MVGVSKRRESAGIKSGLDRVREEAERKTADGLRRRT